MTSDNNNKLILLTEDDPFLIDIYTKKLQEADYLVEVARNGEECLKKLSERIPSLLLLDIVLPRLDGWQVLDAIKKDAKLKTLKVIILSNLSQKEEIEKGLKLGAVKYFIKTQFLPGEIVEEIKKTLNGK